MKRFLSIAIAGVMLTSVASAGMTITSNYVRALVNDSGVGSTEDTTNNTSIPFSTLLEADNGESNSRIQIDYSQTATQTVLSYGLNQSRGGDYFDYAYAQDNTTHFTVDADTTYNLSGYFNADDVSTTNAGRVLLRAQLYDQTDGHYEAYSYQYSDNTLDESLVLGVSGGDVYNNHFGSLTGLLTAGNSYQFYWIAYILAYPTADDGASAVGNVTLTLGGDFDADPVPEPASLAMWGMMGGLGLFAVRRKRRQKANVG